MIRCLLIGLFAFASCRNGSPTHDPATEPAVEEQNPGVEADPPIPCGMKPISLLINDFTFEDLTPGQTGTWANDENQILLLKPNAMGTVALSKQFPINKHRGAWVQARFRAARASNSTEQTARVQLVVRDEAGTLRAQSGNLEIPGSGGTNIYFGNELQSFAVPIAVASDAATLEIRFESEDQAGVAVSDVLVYPYYEDREEALPGSWGGETAPPPEGCDFGRALGGTQELCTLRFASTGALLHIRYRTESFGASFRVWGYANHNSWDLATGPLPATTGFQTVEVPTSVGCDHSYVVTIEGGNADKIELDAVWVTPR